MENYLKSVGFLSKGETTWEYPSRKRWTLIPNEKNELKSVYNKLCEDYPTTSFFIGEVVDGLKIHKAIIIYPN